MFERRKGADLDARADRLGDALAFWAMAAFGILVLFASYWIPAAQRQRALDREETRVLAEIEALSAENDRLDSRLRALYNDAYYLERQLRREHGYLPEGEKAIKPGKVSVHRPGR